LVALIGKFYNFILAPSGMHNHSDYFTEQQFIEFITAVKSG
jgi:hypothetical protein